MELNKNELKRPVPVPERRAGNTTRLADYYIQLLFFEGEITVRDHYNETTLLSRNSVPTDLLFRTIEKRLKSEHQMQSFLFNKSNRVIKLLK